MSDHKPLEDMRKIAQAAVDAHRQVVEYAGRLCDILICVRDGDLTPDAIDEAMADALAKWRG